MLNAFIFIVLPYVALALFLFVTPYRYFSNRLTWSAYSTQFLEQKTLYWGSNPWHYGIIPVLIAHLVGRNRTRPHEGDPWKPASPDPAGDVGSGLGLLALFGCLVLLIASPAKPPS